MYNSLEAINDYLINFFGDNLISLIIFGSYSKKNNFNITSDIDYFIVLKKMPKAQSAISRQIKRMLKDSFPLLTFNIYSQNQFEKIINNNYWLVLSLKEGYTSIYDKNNYFIHNINNLYQTITNKKIGELSWYIKNYKYPSNLLNHYRNVSDEFLKSAQIIFVAGQTHIALELLQKAVHTFMIGRLLNRNFYITSGEITQLFFNVFDDPSIAKYKSTFLRLEQSTGQYYSFGFDKKGVMSFGQAGSQNGKKLFKSCVNKLQLLKQSL